MSEKSLKEGKVYVGQGAAVHGGRSHGGRSMQGIPPWSVTEKGSSGQNLRPLLVTYTFLLVTVIYNTVTKSSTGRQG